MTHGKTKYIVSKPESFDDNYKYPTVIFMHGAGTRGDNVENICLNPFFCERNILLDQAVVYAPLCNHDSWFDMFESIREFAHFVYQQKNTDKTRLYLVGASMGGYAVWQMMMSDPQLYAGAIPICGGGMYWNSARLKDIKIWAFHGKKDPVVLCEESIKMVDCINRNGGNAKVSVLDEYEHDVWMFVYQNPEPFQWLLGCRKEREIIQTSNQFNSADLYG